MKSFVIALSMLSVVVSVNAIAAESPVPGSNIRPESLLTYTYQSWLSQVKTEYKCESPKVVAVQPNATKVKEVISEKWVADVCGKSITFVPILAPDGNGGYITAIGKAK